MADTKPLSAWAVASAVSAGLGFLAALPLPFIDYQQLIGGTAGVGVIGPLLLGVLSGALCLLGVIFGAIALARTRSGERRGWGTAWAGVLLGSLPLLVYLLLGQFMWGWW
jgi:hypothetical protein